MKQVSYIFLTCCLLLVCGVILTSHHAAAQANTTLIHRASDEASLPPPGNPVELTVYIRNAPKNHIELQALIDRDGQSSILTSTNVRFDERDQMYYQFTLPSPEVELSYHFQLTDGSKPLVTSTRYALRRPCRPISTDAAAVIVNPQDKLDSLLLIAETLDAEISNYEQIFPHLNELNQMGGK